MHHGLHRTILRRTLLWMGVIILLPPLYSHVQILRYLSSSDKLRWCYACLRELVGLFRFPSFFDGTFASLCLWVVIFLNYHISKRTCFLRWKLIAFISTTSHSSLRGQFTSFDLKSLLSTLIGSWYTDILICKLVFCHFITCFLNELSEYSNVVYLFLEFITCLIEAIFHLLPLHI